MNTETTTAAPARCLFVWIAATTALVVLLRLLLADLRATFGWLGDPTTAPATLEEALAGLAAALLAGCLLWWWAATTFAVVEAATSVRLGPCPRLIRRTVLVACGVGLVSGLSPAHADQGAAHSTTRADTTVVAGLQLPDRQTLNTLVRPRRSTPTRAPSRSTVTVRSGDSLWSIAEADLPAGSDATSIDARWREIWAANRALIGGDPDLIHPDTHLHLPSPNPDPQEK